MRGPCSEETKQRIAESVKKSHEQRSQAEKTAIAAKISAANTGREVSEETRQKLSNSLMGHKASHAPLSDAHRNSISDGLEGHTVSEVTRRKIGAVHKGNQYKLGFITPVETRLAISQTLLSHEVSETSRNKMAESKEGNKNALGHIMSEDSRQQMLLSMTDSLKRYYEHRHLEPNFPERILNDLLEQYFPKEWKYVGNYQVWFGRHNPDFMNINGRKLLIEVFGDYWHDPIAWPNKMTSMELIEYYAKFGFKCLVLWEHELYDEGNNMPAKLVDFCNGEGG